MLRACLKSVSSQTVPPNAVWLVDDASTDGTLRVFRAFQRPGWHYLRNDRPLGPGRSRQRALDRVRGDVVAFLDSDDIWHPQKLERQLRSFSDPRVMLSHTGVQYIDGRGRAMPCPSWLAASRRAFWTEDIPWKRFCPKPLPMTSALMVRRAALRRVGKIDPRFRYLCDDIDMKLRLVRAFGQRSVDYIPRRLVKYRLHGDQTWGGFQARFARPDRSIAWERGDQARESLMDYANFHVKWRT